MTEQSLAERGRPLQGAPWTLVSGLGSACLLLAVGASGPTYEQETSSADQVTACVEANAPKRTMKQRLELESVDRTGEKSSMKLKLEWKRGEDGLAKMVMRISSPPGVRGTAFLMVGQEGGENDLFTYLPEVGRVRRITSRMTSGSLFGSDFSYEDVEHLQRIADAGSSKRIPDAEAEGRTAYVLEGTPDPASGSAYTRIVSYIDRERCTPLRIDFYEDDEIRKRLTAPPEKVVQENGIWIPYELSITDSEEETRSVMRIEEVELDVDIPDGHFSQGALERRR